MQNFLNILNNSNSELVTGNSNTGGGPPPSMHQHLRSEFEREPHTSSVLGRRRFQAITHALNGVGSSNNGNKWREDSIDRMLHIIITRIL